MAKRLYAVLLAASLVFAGCSGPSTITVSGGTGNGTLTGQLYVATPTSILHFTNAFKASGNVAPIATISGAATGLSGVHRIALDAAANRLYVANPGTNSILIFESVSTTNGNFPPNRTISGASTLLAAPSDLAVDPNNNLLYVVCGANILVFAAASTINGDVPPVRNINFGTAIAGLFGDPANNRLYVADGANNAVSRLDNASLQNGGAVVGGTLVGPSTLLASPSGLTLDTTGRLIVSNLAAPQSLTFYTGAAIATGDQAPAADITGPATGLVTPGQLAFNKTVSAGEVFVADSGAGSVIIFTGTNTASGNVVPSRIITGAATGLTVNGVTGIALDPTR